MHNAHPTFLHCLSFTGQSGPSFALPRVDFEHLRWSAMVRKYWGTAPINPFILASVVFLLRPPAVLCPEPINLFIGGKVFCTVVLGIYMYIYTTKKWRNVVKLFIEGILTAGCFARPGVSQVEWCIEVCDGFTFYSTFIFWGPVILHLDARACTLLCCWFCILISKNWLQFGCLQSCCLLLALPNPIVLYWYAVREEQTGLWAV